MSESQQFNASFERQQLLEEAHSLVALIGNKPNCLKLLRVAIDSLRLYAGYKSKRLEKQRQGRLPYDRG